MARKQAYPFPVIDHSDLAYGFICALVRIAHTHTHGVAHTILSLIICSLEYVITLHTLLSEDPAVKPPDPAVTHVDPAVRSRGLVRILSTLTTRSSQSS